MKKIKTIDLRLEKEVVSCLTQDDLMFVKGGITAFGCRPSDGCVHPQSYYPEECRTKDCAVSQNMCMSGGDPTCITLFTEVKTTCDPVFVPLTETENCKTGRV